MGRTPDATGSRIADDALMTNTMRPTNIEVGAERRQTSRWLPSRRWVGRSLAAAVLAGGLGMGTVAYGFGSSPGGHRVAIIDGTSNT
jgi:hypothetical protein